MKKVILFGVTLVLVGFGCGQKEESKATDDPQEISSFADCVAAGNAVMESHPRQCKSAEGETFVEEIDLPIDLSAEEITAQGIAQSWVEENAQTYIYDGMGLYHDSSTTQEDGSVVVKLGYSSRHGGFGDRTGMVLIPVITPHTIELTVQDGKVVRAVTDDSFDEMTGK